MPQDHRTLIGARARPRRVLRGQLVLGMVVWSAISALDAPEAQGKAPRRKRAAAARRAAVRDGGALGPGGSGTAVPSRAGWGHVVFVTDQRAYLDRGSRDGLKVKQAVQIQRGGRPIASCKVEETSARQATCTGARLRAGDTFRLRGERPSPKTAAPTALAAVTAPEILQRRAQRFADAPQELVDFQGVHLFGGPTRVHVNPSVTVWRTQSDPRFAYTVEQIDAAIRAYELGGTGLQVDAAFSAMRWSAGAAWADVSRFRPGSPTQFYLWQAELLHRKPGSGTVFAVGRIWPWHLPGVTLLDGFQLGRRNQSGTAEAGVYAGLQPTPSALAPATDTWGAGVYGTLTEVGTTQGLFRLARQEARLGLWHAGNGAGTPWAVDGEATGQVWLGPTSIAAGGRVRSGGATGTRPVLERAFLGFRVRPSAVVSGGVQLRYFSVSPGAAELRGQVPAARGGVHAVGDVHASPRPWLGFAGFAGWNGDRDTGSRQRHVAAEVRLPRLVGPYAGLALGAEAQDGWLRARVLYADLASRLRGGLFAWARVSATATQFPAPLATPELHELGGQLHIDGAIASWVRVQVWGAARFPWLIRGEPPPLPSAGLTAGLGLRGVF